ncbi:glycerol-3-phosphate dehydrogenase/oxidase [Lacisediminihabitans changchengi]|uniref:Glycerol-3-phosphate dehydrogenase/oxidase n=1 Tax=Lacisediminihabitans changchengi TaxID=2787634 RepID=A0A934SVH2_9MICO|nr:glycerol-3-phosphate dehydrogenase/oxidase [Lacisediminihabitans changchengi]MBK4348779.1 glycerol-3-phosphate dehydrogenase/oxidase [Lacisediminihabitans changchengi]
MARTVDPSGKKLRAEVAELRLRPSADVLIVGGGINGLSTFRDLALQGVDVALVERGDFLSGASSASSHMIHGGVRYLENGEFRLVSESVHERNGLLRTAPHYVRPLQTTIPIYSTFGGLLSAPLRFLTHKSGAPKERGAFLIKVGLSIYDSFSRDGGAVPRHVFHARKRSLRDLPRLNSRVKYTATYYDASVNEPERLGLDVLADGLAAGPVRAANYVEAVRAEGGAIVLRDAETGIEFPFTAKVLVNASGPWTDLTNEALGKKSSRLMGGTKGSHIVLDNDELLAATGGREIFFENDDGRIVLIQPIKGRVMVGTTDLEADPREPALCTEEEVDYFFNLVSHVFPTITLDRTQIVYRFSGIRPLPAHEDTQPGFVSRDYRIVETAMPALPDVHALSLVGGKWTTFRALGEQLSAAVLAKLGVSRTVSTVNLAIGGGRDFPRTPDARTRWVEAHRDAMSRARADQLLTRYGTRAAELIDAIAEVRDEPLVNDASYSRAEITHLAREEHVVRLLDLVLRRTNHAFTGGVTVELLAELSEIVGDALGWDELRRADEILQTVETLTFSHGMTLEQQEQHPA